MERSAPGKCCSRRLVRGMALFLVWAGLFCTLPVYAHPDNLSTIYLNLEEGRLELHLKLHIRELSEWFPPGKYPDYTPAVVRELDGQAKDLVDIRIDDEVATPTSIAVTSPEAGIIALDAAYPCPALPRTLDIWSRILVNLPGSHSQLVFVEDDRGRSAGLKPRTVAQAVLQIGQDAATFELPEPRKPGTQPVAASTQASSQPAVAAAERSGTAITEVTPGKASIKPSSWTTPGLVVAGAGGAMVALFLALGRRARGGAR